jgi:hypothetical protein
MKQCFSVPLSCIAGPISHGHTIPCRFCLVAAAAAPAAPQRWARTAAADAIPLRSLAPSLADLPPPAACFTASPRPPPLELEQLLPPRTRHVPPQETPQSTTGVSYATRPDLQQSFMHNRHQAPLHACLPPTAAAAAAAATPGARTSWTGAACTTRAPSRWWRCRCTRATA